MQALGQGEVMDTGAGGQSSAGPAIVDKTLVAVSGAEQRQSRALAPFGLRSRSFQPLWPVADQP
jgi:hypothetical protein